MGSFGKAVFYLNLGASLALLIRLSFLRLIPVYRWLTAYLLAYALAFLITAPIPIRSKLYGNIYMLVESINVILSILVVQELVGLTLARHPAVAIFGRKVVAVTMGLAALLAAGGVMLDSAVLPGQSKLMHRFFTAERSLDFALLVVLLAVGVFMLWFPVELRRNIVLYIGGFAVFYFSRTFGLLMINLLPPASLMVITNILMSCSVGCLIAWFFGLRRENEDTTTVVGHRWDPGAIERLSGQLETINTALVRFGRGQT
jgi:hypothetical protein